MRLLKTHSHISNRLAMEPGTREEKQLKETQTLQQGKTTHQKPAVCRRCGGGEQKRLLNLLHTAGVAGGGQERLYGKPDTKKLLWRGEPSSIRRGTQTRKEGSGHAKNLPRAIGKAGA